MSAIARYDAPYQFEPLLPSPLPPQLLCKASDVVRAAARLTGQAHPASRAVLRELLRSMNSYYSNRIEGHGTHPQNIERALRSEFPSRPDISQLQRVALAHIHAEREFEQLLADGENP